MKKLLTVFVFLAITGCNQEAAKVLQKEELGETFECQEEQEVKSVHCDRPENALFDGLQCRWTCAVRLPR